MHISQLFLSLCAVLGADAAAVIGGTSPSSSSPAPQYTQLTYPHPHFVPTTENEDSTHPHFHERADGAAVVGGTSPSSPVPAPQSVQRYRHCPHFMWTTEGDPCALYPYPRPEPRPGKRPAVPPFVQTTRNEKEGTTHPLLHGRADAASVISDTSPSSSVPASQYAQRDRPCPHWQWTTEGDRCTTRPYPRPPSVQAIANDNGDAPRDNQLTRRDGPLWTTEQTQGMAWKSHHRRPSVENTGNDNGDAPRDNQLTRRGPPRWTTEETIAMAWKNDHPRNPVKNTGNENEETANKISGNDKENATYPHLDARAEGGMNCKGSMGCPQLRHTCPKAEELIADDLVYHTGGSAAATGVWKRTAKLDFWGCGIFIQKKRNGGHVGDCAISGKEMRDKVKKVREFGCKICGNYDLGDGCEVVINYSLKA